MRAANQALEYADRSSLSFILPCRMAGVMASPMMSAVPLARAAPMIPIEGINMAPNRIGMRMDAMVTKAEVTLFPNTTKIVPRALAMHPAARKMERIASGYAESA